MKRPIEQWRTIPGVDPAYQVSDLGNVRSFKVYGAPAPRLLKQADKDGYRVVQLSRERFLVHRLVLAAFVGPRPHGMLTRHLNGKRDDNRLVNLAYGTASENMADRLEHGNDPQANRTHCPQGHEYTPENTLIKRRSPASRGGATYRLCRTCRNAVKRENYRRKVAKTLAAVDAANGGDR